MSQPITITANGQPVTDSTVSVPLSIDFGSPRGRIVDLNSTSTRPLREVNASRIDITLPPGRYRLRQLPTGTTRNLTVAPSPTPARRVIRAGVPGGRDPAFGPQWSVDQQIIHARAAGCEVIRDIISLRPGPAQQWEIDQIDRLKQFVDAGMGVNLTVTPARQTRNLLGIWQGNPWRSMGPEGVAAKLRGLLSNTYIERIGLNIINEPEVESGGKRQWPGKDEMDATRFAGEVARYIPVGTSNISTPDVERARKWGLLASQYPFRRICINSYTSDVRRLGDSLAVLREFADKMQAQLWINEFSCAIPDWRGPQFLPRFEAALGVAAQYCDGITAWMMSYSHNYNKDGGVTPELVDVSQRTGAPTLTDYGRVWQRVLPAPVRMGPNTDQREILDGINAMRAGDNAPPVTFDAGLSTIAQAAIDQPGLMEAHAAYDPANSVGGIAEGSPSLLSIQAILAVWRDEGLNNQQTAARKIVNKAHTRVGIGVTKTPAGLEVYVIFGGVR